MTTLPSSTLLIYFKDYEQSHQTKGNKIIHFFGIPLVIFSTLGLLAYLTLWTPSPDSLLKIDLGLLLAGFAAFFSLRVDYKMGIPFALFIYLNYLLARHCSLTALIIMNVIGWIFQFGGHIIYEKKSPAFLTSLQHIFIGPMWIFAWTIGYYRPTASK